MASSSHAPPAVHRKVPHHSVLPLLRNRFSLQDFRDGLESLKVRWGYYEEGGYQRLKDQLPKLGDNVDWPHIAWATFSLEQRRHLVVEVLPRLEASVGLPVEERKKLATIEYIASQLDIKIQKLHGQRSSRIYEALDHAEKTAAAQNGAGYLTKELLAELTPRERELLEEIWRTTPGLYDSEAALLIAVHEAEEQERYDRLHRLERNPLIGSRPSVRVFEKMGLALAREGHTRSAAAMRRLDTEFGEPGWWWEHLSMDQRVSLFNKLPAALRKVEQGRELPPLPAILSSLKVEEISLIPHDGGHVRTTIATIALSSLDKRVGPAWRWAMLREFDDVTVADLTSQERKRLVEYLNGCVDGTRTIHLDPERILRVALGDPHPAHASTMQSLSHFHPRLNLRQAAYYGTG